jgi:hypothetical protein
MLAKFLLTTPHVARFDLIRVDQYTGADPQLSFEGHFERRRWRIEALRSEVWGLAPLRKIFGF